MPPYSDRQGDTRSLCILRYLIEIMKSNTHDADLDNLQECELCPTRTCCPVTSAMKEDFPTPVPPITKIATLLGGGPGGPGGFT